MQPNIKNSLKFFLMATLGICFPFIASAVSGQDYPNKPITIYCGFDPGATTDLTARALAREASKELNTPVVVENKPGAGSGVAATLLASKKADGYTLGVVSSTALVTAPNIMKMQYDSFKDFTYIFSYGIMGCAICVLKDSPFKTLEQLLEYARKNPERLSYGSTAMAPIHLAVDYLARQAKVKFKFVPYKGSTPAATALLGGHIDFMSSAGIHRIYVKQGTFRMLAVINSEARHPENPDVPTITELGYKDIPPPIYMFIGPKDLPEPILRKLDMAFRKAVYSPDFQDVMKNLGVPFVFKDKRQLERDLFEEYQFFGKFLKDSGFIK